MTVLGWLLYVFSFDDDATKSPRAEIPLLQGYEGKVVYTTDLSFNRQKLEDDCQTRGGEFNNCGTTCAPDAAACVQVCAYTCENISNNEKNTSENWHQSDDWITYQNNEAGYEIDYLSQMRVEDSRSDMVRFQFFGPTQELGTEIYDGISLTIQTEEIGGRTVEELARDSLVSVQPIGEVTKPLEEATLHGMSGYAYTAETLGTIHHLILEWQAGHALHISYSAPDPDNRSYAMVVDTMLSSLEPISISEQATIDNLIELETLQPGQTISSPLQVSGRARGPWYFEGTFSVRLADSASSTIAEALAEAQSTWMTEEWVDFVADLEFDSADVESSAQGYVVLEKANPSGLPQMSQSLVVPVYFQ